MVNSSAGRLDLIFGALADPTRRAMLRRLSDRERPITEIAAPFDMSLAAVSKHVKVLERAGLVRRRREGSFSYLRLNPQALQRADHWMNVYRPYWEGRLEALRKFVEQEPA